MTIRFLGQSGYLIRSGATEILIDPYLSDSVNKEVGRPRILPIPISPQDLQCDAMICTHNHLDHLDPDTVFFVDDHMLFLTTNDGKGKLKSLGKENVIAMKEGKTVTIGNIEITAVFADHTIEAFGIILKGEGKTLYFSGDTLYHEKLFKIADYHPDIAFLCMNGRLGNMNVDEALDIAKRLGAKVNVPNHYDMFASNAEDPRLFADHVRGGFVMEFNKTYQVDSCVLLPIS